MPKSLSQEEVQSILRNGNFNELIGMIENEWLECKNAPYDLKDEKNRQELAKDVSAFANVEGGIILIGVETQKDPTVYGDEIRKIHAFPEPKLDKDQYYKILSDWIYPALQQLEIHWFKSNINSKEGIVAISIPNQAVSQRPFLITKILDNKGKKNEVIFGYIERKRANALSKNVQHLHGLIKDGLRFESIVNQQLGNIQGLLQQHLKGHEQEITSAVQINIEASARARIDGAISELGLQNELAYVLAAVPMDQIEIPSLFQSRKSEIVSLIENPPEIRPSGFDLNTGESVRFREGELLKTINYEYKSLELWRDGILIFAATGGTDFLCWPGKPGVKPKINQLVLIESTILFAELSKAIFLYAEPKPKKIQYKLEIRNMPGNDTSFGLIPGPLRKFPSLSGDIHPAPGSKLRSEITWEGNEINPGNLAFRILCKVYSWFGIAHDQIPYTKVVNGELIISREDIKKAGEG